MGPIVGRVPHHDRVNGNGDGDGVSGVGHWEAGSKVGQQSGIFSVWGSASRCTRAQCGLHQRVPLPVQGRKIC